MRTVLLDENLPQSLKREFGGHQVTTVPERGWSGMANGEILTRASSTFEVFVTADQGIEYQQNLGGADLGVVIVRAPSTRVEDLEPMVDEISAAIEDVEAGQLIQVSAHR